MTRPARSLLACLLVLAAACGGSDPAVDAGPPAAGPDGEVHLFSLVRLQAAAEGVPCDPDNVPVLSAAAAERDRLQAAGEAAFLLLVGDTLVRGTDLPGFRPLDVAVRAKAGVQLEALAAARPAAWTPGPTDLAGEHFGEIVERAGQLGLPLLLSNVVAPGHPQIQPWVLLEGGGLRLGVLGVLPHKIADFESLAPGADGDAERIKRLDLEGASLIPAREAIERLGSELLARHGVHFVVVLSNLSGKANSGLAGAVDNLIILGSTEKAARADRVLQVEGSALLNALPGGTELAHTRLRVVGGDMSIRDISPRHTLPAQIASDRRDLEQMQAFHGTQDLDRLARLVQPGREEQFKRRVALIGENEEWLALYEGWEGSAIDHSAAVGTRPPPGPVEAALARQGPAIEEAYAAARLKPPVRPEGPTTIPLPDDCVACHPAQVRHWQDTAHARSFDTLRRTQRQHDPACLGCHTTAWDTPLGWNDPRFDAPLGPVACWSCHGTLTQHASKPRQAVDPAVAGVAEAVAMDCEGCHGERRSPGFERESAVAAVACPPLRDDEPPILLARQAALDQIAERRSKGLAEERDRYLEARALMGLGRSAEALPILRLVAESNVDDTGLAVEIARLGDDYGHSRLALDTLRGFLAHQAGDEAANWAYADLLLHASDETARDAAAAVRHLALLLPPDPATTTANQLPLRRLQVEALFASGQRAESWALLDTLLRNHVDDKDLLRLKQRLAGG